MKLKPYKRLTENAVKYCVWIHDLHKSLNKILVVENIDKAIELNDVLAMNENDKGYVKFKYLEDGVKSYGVNIRNVLTMLKHSDILGNINPNKLIGRSSYTENSLFYSKDTCHYVITNNHPYYIY